MLFNDNWKVTKDGGLESKIVSLPYDNMIFEERKNDNPGGKNNAYFSGGKYIYEKDFETINIEENKYVLLLEGIYQKAKIYLNDSFCDSIDYGYVDGYIDLNKYIKDGVNHLTIEVDNCNLPNSRWYSGSGIIRDVHLYVLPKKHIILNSLKIKTINYKTGLVKVSYSLSEIGNSKVEIIDDKNDVVVSKEILGKKDISIDLTIPNVKLWSDTSPNLYTFKVSFENHEIKELSGIRQIELDKEKGLLINGERKILLGACLHHDNTLLGAISTDFLEERRVKKLKSIGFNAIRSSHNPCSRALLRACDKEGMYLIDEYADAFYIPKTKYDCSSHVLNNWKKDFKLISDKNYNHPSVIMFSFGNEVSETSEKKGIALIKEFNEYFKTLDSSRFTTCGINVFFNALYSLGFGVYSEKKAEEKNKKKSSGSEFFNQMAGLFGAEFMKTGACIPLVDRKTKDAFSNMDVAGYNYGIKRYKHDLKKYKSRFILGSETFISDINKFLAIAKDNNRVIGDFIWVGIDYLGECGIGSMIDLNKVKITDEKNYLFADSGVIDACGNENCQSEYMKVAFNKEIVKLGVIYPSALKGKHTPSSWRFTRALPSWSFKGEEGKLAQVEIYSKAPIVELYLNGILIKIIKNLKGFGKCKMIYEPGELKAVAKNFNGDIIGQDILQSASDITLLKAESEEKIITLDSLAFVQLKICDDKGIIKPFNDTEIKVTNVINGKLISLSSACAYNPDAFFKDETSSYYGRLTAVIKPLKKGEMIVEFSSKYSSCKEMIKVI